MLRPSTFEPEVFMDSTTIARTMAHCALAAGLIGGAAVAFADDDDKHQTTHATFGRGLNTAQQGNVVNHVVLPNQIQVKAGGVVDFGVAGFHDIIVFKPGFTFDDLVAAGGGQVPNTPPAFVLPSDPLAPLPPELAFLTDKIHYRGLNPAGGPLATAVTGNPANGSNRREAVAFLDKGTYLVICNVRGHLLDGMMAYVKVN
jgi:plastocyanin